MRKAKIPLTNFQFGEISPSLIARTDTKIYNNSAQKIENELDYRKYMSLIQQ